jgi:hypothetical protein
VVLSTFAVLVGLVFLAVGVLGFIPGVTTDLDELEFAGPDSQAMLFGIFQVSVLHNIVHLLFGVLGLLLAWSALSAFLYLVIGGLVYLALWIFGLSVGADDDANFIPVNTADDWLHFGLGIGTITLGLIGWAAARVRR